MGYGMIGYFVPHSIYLKGYHCNTALPLLFMNIASQKNFIAIYHMGVYAEAKLMKWFTDEYAKVVPGKMAMERSCLRFKKIENIPYELMGKLASKISVKEWIELYEEKFIR